MTFLPAGTNVCVQFPSPCLYFCFFFSLPPSLFSISLSKYCFFFFLSFCLPRFYPSLFLQTSISNPILSLSLSIYLPVSHSPFSLSQRYLFFIICFAPLPYWFFFRLSGSTIISVYRELFLTKNYREHLFNIGGANFPHKLHRKRAHHVWRMFRSAWRNSLGLWD